MIGARALPDDVRKLYSALGKQCPSCVAAFTKGSPYLSSAYRSHCLASGLMTLDFSFNQPGCFDTSSDFSALLWNNAMLLGACLLPIISVMPLMMLRAYLRARNAGQSGSFIRAASFVKFVTLRRESSRALEAAAVLKLKTARSMGISRTHSSGGVDSAPSSFRTAPKPLKIQVRSAGSGETLQPSAPKNRPKVEILDSSSPALSLQPPSPDGPTVAHSGGGSYPKRMPGHGGGLKVTVPGSGGLKVTAPRTPLPPMTPKLDPAMRRKLQRSMSITMPKQLEHSAEDATRFHHW